MHDSESEESDNDFGGYNAEPSVVASILSDNEYSNTVSSPISPTKSVIEYSRKYTISKRKQNHVISDRSFQNFRIRAWTVDKPKHSRNTRKLSEIMDVLHGMSEIDENEEDEY